VDLSVPTGSVYGFLGQNGAGKTTTIRLMLGLLRRSAGELRLFGRDVARDRRLASAGVGSLVEMPSLYDRLTGLENLNLTRLMLALPRSEIGRVLEVVDLASAADQLVGSYSLGMRQRLGVARALIGKPRLLVLDEPSNGLDPDGIRDMRHLIRTMPQQGDVTVFVSSHLLAEVEQVASHVGLMHKGRLLLQTELATLKASARRRIDIGVAEASEAAAKLRSMGIDARCMAPEAIEVDVAPSKDPDHWACELNRILVDARFRLFRLQIEQPGLEDIYLQRVGAEVAAARTSRKAA
jgi:ABC-2 type transport system ATP-binding protein